MTEPAPLHRTADGPEAVLRCLVRRLRLPYSGSFVAAHIADHAQPSSLLALVEVGAQLGMRITPARADAAALDEIALPAVVHVSADQHPGGFAVLEAVAQDHVQLWNSATGRHQVARARFSAQWSGVVAPVELDPSAQVVEKGHRRHRVLEALSPRGDPPTLAGGRAAPALRAVVMTLTAALLVLAVAGQPSGTHLAAAGLVALTAAGLAVTGAMVRATAGGARAASLPGCPRGRVVNCDSVLRSPYARVAGVPLTEAGTAFFAAVLLLLATGAVWPGSTAVWAAAGIAYWATVPVAIVLVGLQIAMRRFCTLCLLVHALVGAGAAVSWLVVREPWTQDVAGALGLLVVYGVLILFAGLPYVTRFARLRELLATQHRLASSPYATLAHLLTAPSTEVRGTACGMRLEGPEAGHELTVFAHPTCPQCGRTVQEARALAAAGQAEVYLAILPRDRQASEQAACAALVAVGLGLGTEAMLDAYTFAKEGFDELLDRDPVATFAAQLGAEPAPIEAHLDHAGGVVARAAALADDHVDGTPAAFLDTRPLPATAPLGHVALLLEHHPELLASTLPAAHPVSPEAGT